MKNTFQNEMTDNKEKMLPRKTQNLKYKLVLLGRSVEDLA